MFKITTFVELVKYVAGYILIGLGVFAINNLGVAKMILGDDIANKYFYPPLSLAIEIMTVIVLLSLFALIIYSIVSYIRNRGKTNESPKIQVLKAIARRLGVDESEYTTTKPKRKQSDNPAK